MNAQASSAKKWHRLGRDDRDLFAAAQFVSEDDLLDLPDAWESRDASQGKGFLALPRSVRIASFLAATLVLGYMLGIWIALYPLANTSILAAEMAGVVMEEKRAPLALEHSRRIAQRVAKRFLETTNVAEKIELVRDPKAVAPLVEAFYKEAPHLLDEPMVQLQPLTSVFAGGNRFHRFHAKYIEGDRLVVVQAKDEDQDYKVDWETFARYNPVPWQTFVKEGGPSSATFRVRVTRTNYFNFKFVDRLRLLAYKIEIPDVGVPIYGYARKGSSTAQRLNRFLNVNRENRVMLEFSRPEWDESSLDQQVEILRFVQHGWIQAK